MYPNVNYITFIVLIEHSVALSSQDLATDVSNALDEGKKNFDQ